MTASFTGPLWKKTYPGTQVRPIRGRKRGEVVAVLDETADGTPKHVLVVWDHGHPKGEQWASDCLDIVQGPTPKQLSKLRYLGVPIRNIRSKGEASDLISAALAQGAA